jgi:arsenate reductase-like glutaredoxin family protein
VAKKVDWRYHRKSCVTCKRSDADLTGRGCPIGETVDATKDRRGPSEALAVLDGATKLIVAKGPKVTVFDLAKDKPDEGVLLAHLMGPTGNLRAPTLKVGKTVLVGYNPEAYGMVFGA